MAFGNLAKVAVPTKWSGHDRLRGKNQKAESGVDVLHNVGESWLCSTSAESVYREGVERGPEIIEKITGPGLALVRNAVILGWPKNSLRLFCKMLWTFWPSSPGLSVAMGNDGVPNARGQTQCLNLRSKGGAWLKSEEGSGAPCV